MPSKAHEWLTGFVEASRAANVGAAPNLEQERVSTVAQTSVIPVPEGIAESDFPGVPGALLWEPVEPRDDLMLFQIHGGGFRTGTPAQWRAAAGILGLRTGARAVAPGYRLAPEHPFPAALDDCERAYEAVRAAYPDARVIVAGESAGAGLAAALLMRRRDRGDASPLAGILYSGVFDLSPQNLAGGSWSANAATDALLSPELAAVMAHDYLAGHDPLDPYASPALADLTGLPPLLVLASGSELLRDDSIALAARAGACGVETVLELWPGMHHAWPVVGATLLPEAREALERSAEFIERVSRGRVVGGAAVVDDPAVLAMLPA